MLGSDAVIHSKSLGDDITAGPSGNNVLRRTILRETFGTAKAMPLQNGIDIGRKNLCNSEW